tara:strand:+ start:433 stop:1998 length:1566 start_codon:yes stop_codon:yes gene_type:complete
MDIQPANLNITRVRLLTAIASILLSFQAVYFDDIINRDGIMYLQMVEAYLTGGLSAAQAIYDWPAFSILIAWLHQLTSLSIETSGFILNSLFFILLTDALVLISSLLVTTQRQLSIAALLILCFTPINEYRDFILRDPGYWAFSSLALYQFMLFLHSPSFKSATLWQIFMGSAVLFRIEGSVILLALPLFLLFAKKPTEGLKQLIQASYLLIIALFGIIAFVLSQPDLMAAFSKLNSISTYLNLDTYVQKLLQYTGVIESQILNQFSEEYAQFILITGLLAMLAYKILKTFSVSYLIIYLAATKSTFEQPTFTQRQQLLLYFFTLNILILTSFLFKEYFISSRYTVLAVATLLLIVIPKVCQSIEYFWLTKNNLLLSIIGLSLFYSVADTSTLSSTKTYIKETAIWAAHNLPEDSLVMTDDEFMLYYFNAEKTPLTLCVKPLHQETDFTIEFASKMPYTSGPCAGVRSNDYQYYDYIIVVEKQRYTQLRKFLKTLDLKLIFHTETKHKDGASVYKVIKPQR